MMRIKVMSVSMIVKWNVVIDDFVNDGNDYGGHGDDDDENYEHDDHDQDVSSKMLPSREQKKHCLGSRARVIKNISLDL